MSSKVEKVEVRLGLMSLEEGSSLLSSCLPPPWPETACASDYARVLRSSVCSTSSIFEHLLVCIDKIHRG